MSRAPGGRGARLRLDKSYDVLRGRGGSHLAPHHLREAHRSAYVPLGTEDGPLVFAHRRAYPMLVGRVIEVDCRRRLGVPSFFSSLPPDLGLRTSFGRETGNGPDDHRSLRHRTFSHARNFSAFTSSRSERLTSPLTVRGDLRKRWSAQR
jgi:hypothetical protein